MNRKNNKELLEALRIALDCDYQSDLPTAKNYSVIRQVLSVIAAADYPLPDWNSAVQYLLRVEDSFASAEQARAFLLERLDAAAPQ